MQDINNFGKLYMVATPIGNLEDVTLRSITILSEVDIILAEDTRVTSKLLHHLSEKHGLPTKKVLSYHHHSSDGKKFEIMKLLLEGNDLALVTDAGTPGISDPGNELVDFILTNEPNIKIVPIPGASALTSALSISGFRTDKFIFLGFLPKKGKSKLWTWLKSSEMTFAFYESPRRLIKTLENMQEEFGDNVRIFVARELTKLHEETYRGNISDVLEKLSSSDPRGEVVVVVENKLPRIKT